jgi:hypothetical protein
MDLVDPPPARTRRELAGATNYSSVACTGLVVGVEPCVSSLKATSRFGLLLLSWPSEMIEVAMEIVAAMIHPADENAVIAEPPNSLYLLAMRHGGHVAHPEALLTAFVRSGAIPEDVFMTPEIAFSPKWRDTLTAPVGQAGSRARRGHLLPDPPFRIRDARKLLRCALATLRPRENRSVQSDVPRVPRPRHQYGKCHPLLQRGSPLR